jgi:hypothetical protein
MPLEPLMPDWGGKISNIETLNAQKSQIVPLFAIYLKPRVITG